MDSPPLFVGVRRRRGRAGGGTSLVVLTIFAILMYSPPLILPTTTPVEDLTSSLENTGHGMAVSSVRDVVLHPPSNC